MDVVLKIPSRNRQQGLTALSERNLRADKHSALLDDGSIQIITGDGRKGHSPAAPYDVIHVGAAAPELPQSLVDQLREGGRLFIPIGREIQDVWIIDKLQDGSVKKEKLFGCDTGSLSWVDPV